MTNSFLINFAIQAAKFDMLNNYKNIRHFDLEEINDKKYIYPVMSNDWSYFLKMKTCDETLVSDRVLADVKNNQSVIVFIHPWEGPCGEIDWDILHRWATDNGLSKNQVHFIHGSYYLPTKDYNFTYHPVSQFQMNWELYHEPVAYTPVDRANLILCYNRVRRKHRTLTVCELFNNELFDRSISSYFDPTKETEWLVTEKYQRPDLIEAAKNVDKLLPINLEYDLSTENPAYKLNEEHHSNTFLSLVTETIVEDEVELRDPNNPIRYSPIFFSEKTWKPISIGQPFIIIASKGHLAYLKKLGYKTFDAWWSEDYDNEDDINVKLTLIMRELKKLSALSTDELITLRKDMQSIVIHNQTVYNAFRESHLNQYWEPTYRIIKKIWENF